MSTSNAGVDGFGVFAGVVGVIMAIPFVWSIVKSQLPPAKYRKLEETLSDTESLLRSVVEEGLLSSSNGVPHFRRHLDQYRSSADRLREETYIANTLNKQFCAWFGGLSERISVLCTRVEEVRANICETSAEARAQLTQDDRCVNSLPSRGGIRGMLDVLWGRLRAMLRSDKTNPPHTATTLADAVNPSSVGSPEGMAHATNVDVFDTCEIKHIEEDVEAGSSRGIPCATCQDAEARIRALLLAICTVDQELNSRGVTHPILTRIAQDTRKQLPPASNHTSCSTASRSRTSDAFASDHASTKELSHWERGLDNDSDGESWKTDTKTLCESE